MRSLLLLLILLAGAAVLLLGLRTQQARAQGGESERSQTVNSGPDAVEPSDLVPLDSSLPSEQHAALELAGPEEATAQRSEVPTSHANTVDASESVKPEPIYPKIQVRLVDPLGQPLAHQSVRCRLEEQRSKAGVWFGARGRRTVRARTDRLGRFTLDQRGPRFRYTMRLTQTLVTVGESEQALRVFLDSKMAYGADQESILLQTTWGGKLKGRVEGLAGLPADLVLTSYDHPHQKVSVDSKTGKFEGDDLRPGQVNVIVRAQNDQASLLRIPNLVVRSQGPQDPRLDIIRLTHPYQAIDVHALPPWDQKTLSVSYREAGSRRFSKRAQKVGPGHARIHTLAQRVDIRASGPGSCEQVIENVRGRIEVRLEPAVRVQFQASAHGRTAPYPIGGVRLIPMPHSDGLARKTVALECPDENAAVWLGQLEHTGRWKVQWQVPFNLETMQADNHAKTMRWTTPAEYSKPIHILRGGPLTLRAKLP